MGGRILAVTALLVFVPMVLADEAADRLIERGDKFYANRGKGEKWVEKAIECYEKALAVDTRSVGASHRLAMSCYWLGGRKAETAEKLSIFQKGIDAAKRAIKLDDRSVPSHYWLGVCYGKYGEAKGVMNSLGLVDPIKEEMRRVIELDETYAHGGAYVVLGRMHFKLPGIAGGSNEKAVEYLKKAEKIDKGHLLTHLFLAETYVAMDRREDAVRELRLLIALPDQADRAPENADERAQAKALLEKLEEERKEQEK